MPRRRNIVPRRRPAAIRRLRRTLPAAPMARLLQAFRSNPMDVPTALAVGEGLLRNKLEHKIVETIRHLDSRYPFSDPRYAECYNRLMALGYAHGNEIVGAERIVERALSDFGPSLDIEFVQAFAKLSMREYSEAAEAAEMFERIYESAVSDKRDSLDFCRTPYHASQVANFRGVAAGQMGRSEDAIAAYEKSIEFDPGNHLPYLNLVNLLISSGERDRAAGILERGLRKSRQVHELRMLRDTVHRSARISACMIVKNEEELLPGCLDSIRDWVHEIIVVDTGSTDRTSDIARRYGARVFTQPWQGDFSLHRNYSIEQATGDWIFIIDADERMFAEDVPLILDQVNRNDCGILSLNLYNVYGRMTRRVTFANSVRFFRRDLNLRYEGIVHNDLVLPKDQPVLRTRIRLEHLGYDLPPDRMKQKFERTRALLEKQLAADPDNPFALFNLAELLRGVDPVIQPENAREIVKAAGRVVEMTDASDPSKRHLHLMCLNQKATALLALGENEQALECCDRALAARPDYLDAMISRALAFHRLRRYDDAIRQFEAYLQAQARFDAAAEADPIILSHPDSRDLAHNNLGILYQMTGRLDLARSHYLEALEINPTYREAASLLGVLCLQEGKPAEAEIWFRHQLDHATPTREALSGLASICTADGRYEEAEAFWKRAVDASEDFAIRLEYARFLMNRNRPEDAARLFESAIEEQPAVDRRRQIGDLYYETGDLETAAGYYEQALREGAATPEICNNLGNCLYKGGDFETAIDWYRRAIDLAPEDLLAWRNLGLAQVRLGRPAEAVVSLRYCLEKNPGAFEIAHLLADQYRQLGEYEKAVRLYEQVLRDKPTDFTSLFSLSESYLFMGHKDSALAGYRRVLQLRPDFTPAAERVSELTGSPAST